MHARVTDIRQLEWLHHDGKTEEAWYHNHKHEVKFWTIDAILYTPKCQSETQRTKSLNHQLMLKNEWVFHMGCNDCLSHHINVSMSVELQLRYHEDFTHHSIKEMSQNFWVTIPITYQLISWQLASSGSQMKAFWKNNLTIFHPTPVNLDIADQLLAYSLDLDELKFRGDSCYILFIICNCYTGAYTGDNIL